MRIEINRLDIIKKWENIKNGGEEYFANCELDFLEEYIKIEDEKSQDLFYLHFISPIDKTQVSGIYSRRYKCSLNI